MRILPTALLIAATLTGTVATRASAQETLRGSWTAQFREEGEVNLHFSFASEATGMSNWGRNFDMSELRDLTRPRAAGQSLRFTMPRAAGAFSFEGRGDPESAAGWFEFTPSAAYVTEFLALGLDRPTDRELFAFAFRNLTIADVRALRSHLADELTTTKLARMVTHGVGLEFVQELAELGFKGLTSAELTRTHDHGVTPRFIREMRTAGVDAALQDYVRARDHGVTSDFVRAIRAEGYEAGLAELIRVRDHGVDSKYIQSMRALGIDASIRDLVRARDHGVSAAFIAEMRAAGYNLELHEYIRLRDHGVTAGYARRMTDRMNERPSAEELVRLRSRGVD